MKRIRVFTTQLFVVFLSLVGDWWPVMTISFILALGGCAVDHLKVSMDRGGVSPRVEPSWLDHSESKTNSP